MLISLSEIMNLPTGVQKRTAAYEPDTFVRLGVTYPILEKKEVKLAIENLGGRKVKIGVETTVVLAVPCDNCLAEQRVEIPISSEVEIDFNMSEEDRVNDLNETAYIDGYDLDVDRLVYEEILLGFPMKVLCQEDCKGICKVCGANLNQGECGCVRTEPDPRMSVIRDIFNNVKEV
ncbi:MAG: DUF177 domain-containing protein [Lachnospiraceae bacterium]|nr:DUF177 domain-containing protein [Lachnospiraceae bacterium]